MKRFLLITIFVLGTGLLYSAANKVFAASCSWNGSVSGDWSNAANWDSGCSGPGGIPGDTDELTFPDGALNPVMNNDIVGLEVSLMLFGSSGTPTYTINGNDIDVSGGIVPTSVANVFNININLTGNVQIEAGTYNGDINLGSNTLNLNLAWDDFILNGAMIGTGQIDVNAFPNKAIFNGDSLSYTGLINLTSGNLVVDGNFSDAPVNITGGSLLQGSGRVGTLTVYSGDVAPGVSATDILSVSGDLALNSSDTVYFRLNGTTAGTQYDQIEVAGNVALNDAILNLSVGYIPTLGDQYIIIDATGGSVSGTFAGLPSGSEIEIGDDLFTISYFEDQVVLTRSAVLLFLGFTTNPTTVTKGNNVVLTATWGSRGGPVPTGTVNFLQDNVVIASNIPLVNGAASYTINGIAAGTYSFVSEYSGDSTYGGAISQPFSLQVLATLANTGTNIPVASVLFFGLLSLSLFFVLENKKKKNN